MTEQSKVAPVEAQAVPDLHQQIMNLPIGTSIPAMTASEGYAYALGHRDARHAAAQLVAASPAAAATLPHDFERLVNAYGNAERAHASAVYTNAPIDVIAGKQRAVFDAHAALLAASPVAPAGAPTRQHSVHLAGGDAGQDVRGRPALSAAAPSAEGSLPCCGYADTTAVMWNPGNKVVQCHNCGAAYKEQE